MGKSAEDEAPYRACTECTRLCQTTHGDGLPRSVPKFSRSIPEYALPSEKNCYLQIPAPYCRDHIPIGSKREYILVGVTGSEWRMTFKDIGLKDGWRAFAIDYRLDKGDQVTFALVAPNRFYVDVFNKFGMEKYPVNSRGSPSTIVKKAPQLGPPNESLVSNFTRRADGTPQHTPTQELKPNDICLPSSGKASGENGDHDEKLSPLSRKRALNGKDHLTCEPVETHEEEPSSSSRSSTASDDLAVLLAKKVLSKSKQKKRKKRRKLLERYTVSPEVEAVAEAGKSEGTSGAEEHELCKNLQNEDRAIKVNSVEDRVSKGVAILSSYIDPAGSPRGNDDETMSAKPCEDSIVGVSPTMETPDVVHEPQNLSAEVPDHPEEAAGQKVRLPDQRQDEALDETETARGITGEDLVLKGSEIRQIEERQPSPVFQPALEIREAGERHPVPVFQPALEIREAGERHPVPVFQPALEIREAGARHPIPVFQPGLVKPERVLGVANPHPYRTCTTCTNCGLIRKEKPPIQPRDLKPEPVTTESPWTLEVRSPSSNTPSSSTGRVTENQKQRALIAARAFSATLTNRHATVVMRIGFNEKTSECFVSLNCAEMLPPEATELTLLDSKGVAHKADWNADRRYLQGPGWRDFVESHNLQLTDVFVMEVVERSEQRCVALVHIFHAHEMVNLPLRASPGAITGYVQESPAGPKTRARNLLRGCSPLSANKRTKAPDVVGALRTEPPRPHVSSDDTDYRPESSPTRSSRRTSSSSPSITGRAGAAAVAPSLTNQRTRMSAPNVDAAVVGPPPGASTADAARADTEAPLPSPTTRPRRVASSHRKRATATVSISVTGGEAPRALDDAQAKRGSRKDARGRASIYRPHGRKKGAPKASTSAIQQRQQQQQRRQQHRRTEEPEKQVRTRNSQKVQYPVAKMLDRRKSVQGNVLFLVELGKLVSQSSIHKRMKAKQDGKGRWWVPHHHFTKDFTSCFIE